MVHDACEEVAYAKRILANADARRVDVRSEADFSESREELAPLAA